MSETNGVQVPTHDAVSLQVVDSRLKTLMRLMTRTMEQLAGSAIAREAGDYSTAFMDADGRIIAFGNAVITHLGHEVQIIPWIYENYGRENVEAGDIFISNDPYTGGSVHASDVGCTAPVFAEDQLVGWVFVDMHFADVGGEVPGSFSPSAQDCYAESLRFPPTKIYAGGEYREDVVRAFCNNSRIPTMTARDISAEVASCHVGVRAVAELAEQYGVDELNHIIDGLCEFSEAMFRARIEELPDGIYEGADYIEDGYADDSIYRALVKMIVVGDELLFDFRGSAAAAPALLNCTRSGLVGGLMGPLMQQLATGIPFNAGVMKPVHLRSDPGSFIDAAFPSPVGLATGYGAWAVQDSTWIAASSALEASGNEFLRRRAAAQHGGGAHCSIFSGESDQYGNYSVFLNMDMAAGQGLAPLEGLDGARGANVSLWGSIPSVEAHELHEPFLYLSREFWRDSGGAGQWRGGLGIKSATIVWGEKSSPQSGTFCSVRNSVPSVGRNGGYPASGVYYGPIAGTEVVDEVEAGKLSTCEEIEDLYADRFESMPAKAKWEGKRFLGKGPGSEVFIQTSAAGGGFGDPLARDPQSVERDVKEGYVSAAAASGMYGVILDADGKVDPDATAARREELRDARFEAAQAAASKQHQEVAA